MKKFRRVSGVNARVRVLVGNKYIEPEHGLIYEVDDSVMDVLLKHTIKVTDTPRTRAILDEQGVTYEKIVCPSCGGRVVKLEFCPILEVE